MNQERYSAIAHRAHDIANPLPPPKVDRVFALLDLAPGARAVDLGCGKAEMLLRLVERYGVRAEGVDISPLFLAEARARVAQRAPHASVALHEGDASTYPLAEGAYDAAMCMGATHALGRLDRTIAVLARAARPGGWVLVGEGFWRKTPDSAYLAVTGIDREELRTHAENVDAGAAAGLVPIYAAVASEDDFDDYEWRHASGVESFAMAHPEDPDVPEMLARTRAWRAAYLRWGRETMGFSLYLFRKPL